MKFSEKDFSRIREQGLTMQQVEDQLHRFSIGYPFVHLDRAAVVGDGIERIDEKTASKYADAYDSFAKDAKVVKFVPASGAASRMFKDLYDFLGSCGETGGENNLSAYVRRTMDNIDSFAFSEKLEESLRKDGKGLHDCLKAKDYREIVRHILLPEGLNYGVCPKGVIPFHKYGHDIRTAFEEHLVEGANYCIGKDRTVRIHFTISENHRDLFEALYRRVQSCYEQMYDVKYIVSYSVQKKSTDVIAVNMRNEIVRDSDGEIVFRPSGHGALIENLGELDADIVFIKNIDNVAHDRYKAETYRYKKILGGFLIVLKRELDELLRNLILKKCNQETILRIQYLCSSKLGLNLRQSNDFPSEDDYADYLFDMLNRPLRVCGMVKNENQAGGGPFWVKDGEGSVRRQIIESSQVNKADENQMTILNNATHFNPVDLVCSMKDYKGDRFCLNDFVDDTAGFITEKTQRSERIKVQERPGLWNGAMAKWNTVFVEVPLITFTPVKTLNDLLDEVHQ